MKTTLLSKGTALLFTLALSLNASANNVSFTQATYTPDENGQIRVSVSYDFTDFAMFGGGINLYYDSTALAFASYTRANLFGYDANPQGSPVGDLVFEGGYIGFGIGTDSFFTGVNDAGPVGIFVFDVLGPSAEGPAECDSNLMCLTPNLPTHPMISLAGQDVSDEIFGSGAIANFAPVPVPAAIWFLLSSVSLLCFLGSKNNRYALGPYVNEVREK